MRLFVDNLTNVDFSYLHPQRGLLGETWLANTQLRGKLDHQGMICDFGIVKSTLRHWLDTYLDHRLAVPVNSPNLSLKLIDDQVELVWVSEVGRFQCTAPKEAIALIDSEEITPNSVSLWCIEQITPSLPNSVEELALDFSTEAIDGDFYHYSHGLKKHAGNCQRIAHGHRSKIQIWRNGIRAHDWEAQWARRFTDIYIGTQEDVVFTNEQAIGFAYQTDQGEFKLTTPRQKTYLIDTDSTVELIASHIAKELQCEYPTESILVKAYEGMGKGAMV